MLKVELSEPEAELLREVAEEWLSDLRMEIGATPSSAGEPSDAATGRRSPCR